MCRESMKIVYQLFRSFITYESTHMSNVRYTKHLDDLLSVLFFFKSGFSDVLFFDVLLIPYFYTHSDGWVEHVALGLVSPYSHLCLHSWRSFLRPPCCDTHHLD